MMIYRSEISNVFDVARPCAHETLARRRGAGKAGRTAIRGDLSRLDWVWWMLAQWALMHIPANGRRTSEMHRTQDSYVSVSRNCRAECSLEARARARGVGDLGCRSAAKPCRLPMMFCGKRVESPINTEGGGMSQLRMTSFIVITTISLLPLISAYGQPVSMMSADDKDDVAEGTATAAGDNTQLASDYRELEAERLKLISEMYGQMYEVSTLFTELERAVKLERLQDAIEEKGSGDGRPEIDASEEERDVNGQLAHLRARIRFLAGTNGVEHGGDSGNVRVSEEVRRLLEGKVQDILKKTDQLSNVGAKVTELNNTSYITQTFKQQISWIFASLVGLVIIGFFVVASRDERVRSTIFSGDSGIQFLTLFSIVIAIILFGITGVLEGKEISALIGGISGYILGRSATNRPAGT